MQKKTKKISNKKFNDYINAMQSFGWVIVKTEKRGNSTVINFERNLRGKDLAKAKKLEKNYFHLSRAFPAGALIWTLLAIGAYVAYTMFKSQFFGFAILGAFIAITGIAVYMIIAYIFLCLRRKRLKNNILDVGETLGTAKVFPYPENIRPAGADSMMIARNGVK